jgi:hypothetical protein
MQKLKTQVLRLKIQGAIRKVEDIKSQFTDTEYEVTQLELDEVISELTKVEKQLSYENGGE